MNQVSQETEDRVINLSLNVGMRLALVALLVTACFVIVRPFMVILLWALILAVALSGVFEKLVGWVGGRRGLAAALLSVVAILLVVGPSYVLGGSLVESLRTLQTELDAGELSAPPPPEALAGIPIVGERLFGAWQIATDDIQQAVVQFEPQLRTAGGWAVGFLRGIGGAVLQTLLALIIASVFLTYREGGIRTARAISTRLHRQDEDFAGMAAATINSVAQGVLGVAAIQSSLCAVLLLVAGFPAAGLVALVMLVTSILQVPGILIMILPIVWGFSALGTLGAIGFLVGAIVVGFVDAPLKAMLLGRGLPIPTSIILVGAIGGMVSLGMMGLFVGAVILGIAYRLFLIWLNEGKIDPSEPAVAPA
ncbi:MAG: AI-2E family transporter [Longimicrobiales bacterium]